MQVKFQGALGGCVFLWGESQRGEGSRKLVDPRCPKSLAMSDQPARDLKLQRFESDH